MLSGHLPFWDGPFPNETQMAPLVINCRFFWGCLNSWQLEGTKATHKRVLCSYEPLWGLSSCSTPLCFATPALARTQGKQLLPHAVPVAGEVRYDLIFLLCGSAVLRGSSGAGKQQVGAWCSLRVRAGSGGMSSWLGSFPPFCCQSVMVFPQTPLFFWGDVMCGAGVRAAGSAWPRLALAVLLTACLRGAACW